ncbi:hypothetical protein SAMN05660226_02676 [Parapedobacter luteus]|uniref:Uncharacterized protein n=1 Tax=Parapedobacter luteus TaxID=623280 RepID=A0A1T5DBX4_9SPHI|nr:hypothetical protein SAMN05660226_02676 [Parapedobacter luteus]
MKYVFQNGAFRSKQLCRNFFNKVLTFFLNPLGKLYVYIVVFKNCLFII